MMTSFMNSRDSSITIRYQSDLSCTMVDRHTKFYCEIDPSEIDPNTKLTVVVRYDGMWINASKFGGTLTVQSIEAFPQTSLDADPSDDEEEVRSMARFLQSGELGL